MTLTLLAIIILEAIALFIVTIRMQELEAEASKKSLQANHDAAIASAARTFVHFASEVNLKALKRAIHSVHSGAGIQGGQREV